jgi:hypothetical protein
MAMVGHVAGKFEPSVTGVWNPVAVTASVETYLLMVESYTVDPSRYENLCSKVAEALTL